MKQAAKAWGVVLAGMGWAMAPAAPLAEPSERQQVQAPAADPEAAESPVDVHGWIQRESASALLEGTFESDRRTVLRQGWQGRSPTWIQDASAVNLGDFPNLDNSTERAERELKVLEWVIEEQRRIAAGQPPAHDAGSARTAPDDNWLRRLIPREWISMLKANREWVAAGGTALLVIVWGTTAFARRPTSGGLPPPPLPQPAPAPPRRRRRRYRDASPTAG